MKWLSIITGALLVIAACKEGDNTPANSPITGATIKKHIATLASDDFQGRKPFTAGEEKTLAYLEQECKRIGLTPGNNGSFYQDVPLVEITGTPSATMELSGATNISLALNEQYVAFTQRQDTSINIVESDLVFCGYGIVAPEYNWNDYAGLDMKGKTALILVNDPGLGNEDSTFFKGSTMTYYGRWTYKYEEAAKQGAAAVIIIHEANMAGYPWNIVRTASTGAKLNLQSLDYTPCELQGWMHLDAAVDIFNKADLDLQKAMMAARKPGFKAMPLPYKVNASIANTVRQSTSKNFIATIPGTDQPEEYIIYSAHWDHLGIGAKVDGDSIYNGACDNASGTAALLAIAEAMKQDAPKRTVVFLWVTAEEQGLLGSAYYAAFPVFPVNKTVANMNMDGYYPYGEMRDLSVIGYGQSELEDYAKRAAEAQGRYIMPDQEPEKGYFFRSDHFSFARVGIPALYAKGSYEHKVEGIDYMKQKHEEFRTTQYHQPADEYDEASFNVDGIVQDAELYYRIGLELANSDAWPVWKPGSEFKSIREKK
jgi:Zn-dependent M28 family amino/carboxypeptidase